MRLRSICPLRPIAIGFISGILTIGAAFAGPFETVTGPPIKLKADIPLAGTRFGTELDLTSDGHTLAVASGTDERGEGAVYLFDWNGVDWIETQIVRASDGTRGDGFGAALAIEGRWMIVGAPHAGPVWTFRGAAYLFERTGTGWVERRKLMSRDQADFRYFGSHVALDEQTLVIGALNFPNRREVQIFTLEDSQWTGPHPHSLENSPATRFGAPVAVEGDRLLVGAGSDPAVSLGAGSIYIFERDAAGAWVLESRVTSRDFGGLATLSLQGDRFATGNPRPVFGNPSLGSPVRVTRKENGLWIFDAQILDLEVLPGDAFGCSVELESDVLFVGASQDHEPSFETGALFTYVRGPGGWILVDKRTPSDPYAPLNFGEAIAAEGGVLAVSAPGDGDTAHQSGAVHLYGTPGSGQPRTGGALSN